MPAEKRDVAVIGVGAAGFMCALTAGASHRSFCQFLMMPAGSPKISGFLEVVDAISQIYLPVITIYLK